MKKQILIVAFICCMVSLYAQDAVPTEEINKNAPVITFEDRFMEPSGAVSYDYGTITKGSNGQTYFVFTNTGKEPLVIEKASSSCGCTVPNPPKYPILPGQKDSISVKYDTNRIGSINKTVTLMSNASNNPTIMRIKGNIIENPPIENDEGKQ
jgi:opacity protein-like surface antigen